MEVKRIMSHQIDQLKEEIASKIKMGGMLCIIT